MTIRMEAQRMNPTALVELYELDLSLIAPALPEDQKIVRFAPTTNELGQPLVWQGSVYTPYPIEASGFEINAQGSPPRPTVKAANLGGVLTELCLAYQDLVQAKLSRRRTFARFLDGVNFAAGNDEADPTQELPRDVFLVERKSEENSVYIEWELRWPFDLQGVMLPGRVIAEGICTWQYTSAECGWVPQAGHYYDVTDAPCAAGQDECSKSLQGCRLRFGSGAVLPYGGFPGAGMVRQ